MLLAGVILILIIFALIGWRKGVIRLVLSLVSMIITIMAAVVIAPMAPPTPTASPLPSRN